MACSLRPPSFSAESRSEDPIRSSGAGPGASRGRNLGPPGMAALGISTDVAAPDQGCWTLQRPKGKRMATVSFSGSEGGRGGFERGVRGPEQECGHCEVDVRSRGASPAQAGEPGSDRAYSAPLPPGLAAFGDDLRSIREEGGPCPPSGPRSGSECAAEPQVERAIAILRDIGAGRSRVVQPPHFLAEVAAVLARKEPGRAPSDARWHPGDGKVREVLSTCDRREDGRHDRRYRQGERC